MQQLQNQEEVSEAKRGLLLERLVTLERLQEAEVVLQPWLSGRSTPREPIMFTADLQRRNGQPETARRSLQHLLGLHRMFCRFCSCWCSWTKSRDVSVR